MPGVVNTIHVFDTNQVITSTLMNNIIDETTFTSQALAAGTSTLALVSGRIKVATGGIQANELATGAVTTTRIFDNAVTTSKIFDNAVITSKILDDAVTTAKILDSNVTTAKIEDAAITAPKLNGAQTGTAPIFGCRAWVSFDATRNASGGTDGALTNRFIRASGNVTSVLKTATGTFVVTFTTAMPSANYQVSGSATGFPNHPVISIAPRVGATQTASQLTISTATPGGIGSSGFSADSSNANVSVFG